MKKIITPLGALISLLFVPATWAYISRMTRNYDTQKLTISFYEMFKVAPAPGYVRFSMVLIALILLIVPFILKNPLRKTFVVSLSVVAFILLAAFLSFKSDLSRNGEIIELGMGWFGAAFGFIVAFAGAFVKTAKDAPEKSSMPALAWIVILICLTASLLGYLFLFPPFGSFPMSADGMSRTSSVQYRKDENYPGVYMAVYGMSVLHTLEKKKSAEEAKQAVAKLRESIKQESERARNSWKNKNPSDSEFNEEAEKYYQKDPNAVFFAPEDKPESDLLVFVSGGRTNVIWASGNRFYTVSTPKPEAEFSEKSAAQSAFDFARSLPDPPKNTTAPTANTNSRTFTLYDFYYNDLPLWVSELSLVVVPLIIAVPFLLLLITGLLKRKTT